MWPCQPSARQRVQTSCKYHGYNAPKGRGKERSFTNKALMGHGEGVEQCFLAGSKTGRNPAPSDHYSRGFMAPSKASPWSRADGEEVGWSGGWVGVGVWVGRGGGGERLEIKSKFPVKRKLQNA